MSRNKREGKYIGTYPGARIRRGPKHVRSVYRSKVSSDSAWIELHERVNN